jgi:ribosomal protein L24
MTYFANGDRVIIRFGKQQGQKGTIIGTQPANVYKVKTEDGSVHYYSWKGLATEKEGLQEAGC